MQNDTNKNDPASVVGIPWYTERTWKKMKEISADQESFHDNYQIWLAHADKSVVILTNRNKPFELLHIDPISYSWWCENQSIKRDKTSRRAYIQYLLESKINQN